MLLDRKNIIDEMEEKYEIAKNLFENGVFIPSKEMFIELVLKDPFRWEFWFAIGSIYEKEKNYTQAIISLNMAKILDSKNAEIYFQLAENYLSANDKKKAFNMLDIAKSLSEDKNLLDKIQILKNQNNL
ncbi:MAG: hypothetical protein KR126chlam4_01127 [Candidatus Anoxychlamydiales bacterium]|uniref:Uncharacterized protein n=1 Tax=marine sediment metagenome TaxID=412755 RepID=A0A0F9KDB6_9ZZZZ|nr:hypothetical protein [Candidatus Anoxychlamydiales bacterium]HEU64969.1 hypothetical protein [Chlamydiota bacterium]